MTAELKKIVRAGEDRALKDFAAAIAPLGFVATKRRLCVRLRDHWAEFIFVERHGTRRGDPSTATRQLDFVFASESLAGRVDVAALNQADEWGPSDHCRIRIELS